MEMFILRLMVDTAQGFYLVAYQRHPPYVDLEGQGHIPATCIRNWHGRRQVSSCGSSCHFVNLGRGVRLLKKIICMYRQFVSFK